MKRHIPLIAAILLVSAAGVAFAQAPAAPAALEGMTVLDQKGVVLGEVERVVHGPNGQPAQVLVRPKGMRAAGPRSLSFKAVKVTDKGLQTPLTKAEFDAMPAVEQIGQ